MDPPSDPDQLTSVRSNGLPRGVPAEVADTGLGVAGCEFTVTAELASASVARDRVSRWLRLAGWPPEPLEEVVYAVNEAVSNAIEHAYPPNSDGTVDVTGWLPILATGQRRAVVRVTMVGGDPSR